MTTEQRALAEAIRRLEAMQPIGTSVPILQNVLAIDRSERDVIVELLRTVQQNRTHP